MRATVIVSRRAKRQPETPTTAWKRGAALCVSMLEFLQSDKVSEQCSLSDQYRERGTLQLDLVKEYLERAHKPEERAGFSAMLTEALTFYGSGNTPHLGWLTCLAVCGPRKAQAVWSRRLKAAAKEAA